jgi:hypothetical protein
MTPTLKDYEAYLEEYDKQYNTILEFAGQDGIPFDIGPRLNKAAFRQSFNIAVGENASSGVMESSTTIAHKIARTQLFYQSPKQAERQLAIFDDEKSYENMPPEIKALKGKITKEDLLYGTPSAIALTDFLKEQYNKYKEEDTGDKKGKGKRAAARVSQTFFGS